ncbi:SCP2 sterol-binding domain-containing protein [Lentibacillus salicampi]|uniref:SCP2 sterol-binding domain-containing protein n=1 Tax=Lentibacillus salicampi TaxID=175306 RepID=A0A4Y9AH17_9BACI|nr:SCP2 sterol-binding domain-containing protein [Lentibacillus salicampi]TFJ94250.1 SCP2 sterol-binding domain-containing protein [Lentibacillus salicampi]
MADVNQIFSEIESAIKEDPSRTKGVEAVYQFNLDDGAYQIIFNGGQSYTAEGEQETPDCTLTMNSDNFKKMADGELNGTQAFMTGKLKVKGNMGLALKLQDVLASYNQTAK